MSQPETGCRRCGRREATHEGICATCDQRQPETAQELIAEYRYWGADINGTRAIDELLNRVEAVLIRCETDQSYVAERASLRREVLCLLNGESE